jgi:sugar O-acyltransferase (sialic acid O-acetyltransferase NeuD family)
VEPLLVVGAGGFARETIELVRAINAVHPTWDLLGFLDDAVALRGQRVDDVQVLGRIDDASWFPQARLVVTTGHPGNFDSRRQIVERLALPENRYATLVHPTASLGTSVRVGHGSVLLAYVVATTSVRIGAHVAVMPGTIFTHDDVVEDFATFGAGVRLAGGVRICEGAYVGSGVSIRENRTIGRGALVGMGSVVTKDVPDHECWVGVPARQFRRKDVNGQVLSSRGGP